jgi:hypothetical protein
MSSLALRTLIVAAAVTLLTVPARAAHELEPGLWQDTETALEGGKPGKPEVSKTCLSADEARDPVKTILKDTEGQKCDALNVKENGNVVTVEMKCGDPKQMRIEIDMTVNFVDARHYSGTMKSLVVFGGRKVASVKTIESKWIAAACQK